MPLEPTRHDGLPGYLAPLLAPTRGGFAKLCAAWDGLSMESQVAILTEIENQYYAHPNAAEIRVKALDSPYSYVRYLAARRLNFDKELNAAESALKKRIAEDPSGLVRCALFEKPDSWSWIFDETLKDPNLFFGLSQEIRLAKMRGMAGGGETVAKLVAYALEPQLNQVSVSEGDLYELLSEYLNNKDLQNAYRKRDPGSDADGAAEYFRGRDLSSLWDLIPKAPKSIGFLLVNLLPESTSTWVGTDIPEEVLDGMDPQQLEWLLRRPDVYLREFRRKLFFDSSTASTELKQAAITHNFDLSNEEFGQILSKAPKERVTVLDALAGTRNLRPCIYRAIYDCLEKQSDIVGADLHETRRCADRALENSLRAIKDRMDERILELKVYYVAARAVPWNRGKAGHLWDELKGLSDCLVQDDTWATFMAFWVRGYWWHRRESEIQKLLPRIEEVEGTELAEAMKPAEKGQLESLAEQMRKGFDASAEERSAAAKSLEGSLREMFSEKGKAFETKLSNLEKNSLDALREIGALFLSIRRGLNFVEVLLCVLLALLAWLLFAGYLRK